MVALIKLLLVSLVCMLVVAGAPVNPPQVVEDNSKLEEIMRNRRSIDIGSILHELGQSAAGKGSHHNSPSHHFPQRIGGPRFRRSAPAGGRPKRTLSLQQLLENYWKNKSSGGASPSISLRKNFSTRWLNVGK